MDILKKIEAALFTQPEFLKQLDDSPVKVICLEKVKDLYRSIESAFHYATIYAGVKANDNIEVLKTLNALGSNFEVASVAELELLVKECGVDARRILFSNTSKLPSHIASAHKQGVDRFVSDSRDDLDEIAVNAPGSKVLIRIATDANKSGTGSAALSFDERFGVNEDEAKNLIRYAKERGLVPYGLSVHVGTQQEKLEAWDASIEKAGRIFHSMADEGIKLEVFDLGGGLPSQYKGDIYAYSEYGDHIRRELVKAFGHNLPTVVIEPGRSISAMAGATLCKVINVKDHPHDPRKKVITLTAGQYNAGITRGRLTEMVIYRPNGERLERLPDEQPVYKADFYGLGSTTGDSVYLDKPAPDLRKGDVVAILGTGAYTSGFANTLCKLPRQQEISI